jgi:formylglycine-generating enzyme required for sulfatase activity
MRRAALAAIVLVACGGDRSGPPPFGEALFVVDTDLAVPQLAGRLRVDVFREDGAWIESRDIGRSDPSDWPASFSVYAEDDVKDHLALVRLRAYPEGSTRPYVGERWTARAPHRAPAVAKSLAELCANAPELRLGDRLTLRAGTDPITDAVRTSSCGKPTQSGSIAARVVIEERAAYRFDVAFAAPWFTIPSLFLRTTCEDAASQIACNLQPNGNGGLNSPGHFPRFDATLDPGTYWLLTGNTFAGWPSDLTLEVLRVDVPPPISPAPPPPEEPTTAPRLARGIEDVTPPTEPSPPATVDRIVVVRLVPGVRGRVRVTLRGSCAGTMAKLGADPTKADPMTAETCVDGDALVRAEAAVLDPDLASTAPSLQGTFGSGEACAGSAPANPEIVCIPSGAFLFGSRLATALGTISARTSPERIARMRRFWIDRHEVTVARYRAAVARGLPTDESRVVPSNAPEPMPPPPIEQSTFEQWCSWSAQPMGREDRPLSCVSWRGAHEFCLAQGGDLPTEAQWEYVASAAGRRFKTAYPWGDDAPTCDRAIFARAWDGYGDPMCAELGRGPVPVTAADGKDVTPLGVVGMFGTIVEWMRDAGEPFDGACWQATGVVDPACLVDDAPFRVWRGTTFGGSAFPITARNLLAGQFPAGVRDVPIAASPDQGFRCVYDHPVP